MSEWLEGIKWAERKVQEQGYFGVQQENKESFNRAITKEEFEFYDGALDYLQYYETILIPLQLENYYETIVCTK